MLIQLRHRYWGVCEGMLKTLGMVLVLGYVKSKQYQERTCLSYCDFLGFVLQSTGEIVYTYMGIEIYRDS